MTMPVDELRAAVDKLRDAAKNAAPGPWHASPVWSPRSPSTSGVYTYAYPTGTVESEVVASGRVKPGYGGARNPHNAVWIALVNPTVAEPVIEILEAAITRGEQYDTVTRQLVAIGGPTGGPCLALARAINSAAEGGKTP